MCEYGKVKLDPICEQLDHSLHLPFRTKIISLLFIAESTESNQIKINEMLVLGERENWSPQEKTSQKRAEKFNPNVDLFYNGSSSLYSFVLMPVSHANLSAMAKIQKNSSTKVKPVLKSDYT